MKIALPLGALILLGIMIGYSGLFEDREGLAITFAEVNAVEDDLRMVSPRITGVDANGRPYVMTAFTATQAAENPNLITLETIQADLTLDDAEDWISLSARSGLLQADVEMLDLFGQIDIFSTEGYEFHAERARLDFRNGTLVSDQPVSGQGPLGTLEANGMEATNNGDLLRFTGGVKVVIYGQEE